jgi:hypothetical protein
VLDAYAQQCFDGDLQSCGGRVEGGSVVYCTDLE